MIEHPIRPRERLVKYAELREQDLQEFDQQFQQEQNRQHRPCPACGEDVPRKDFDKDGFTFCRCNTCDCLYVNPVPTEQLLGTYYDGSKSMEYFHTEVLVPTLDTRRGIMRERLQRMEPYIDSSDQILEVGSSIGLFVEAALEKGWQPTAVEINTELVKYLNQNFEIPVYQGFFERLDNLPADQDVVVMWEVIEHLLDPELALTKAHSVLGEGGRLILTLPNVDGLEFQLIGPEHELMEAPGHLNYFSIKTLEKLLSRLGFEVLHYERPAFSTWSTSSMPSRPARTRELEAASSHRWPISPRKKNGTALTRQSPLPSNGTASPAICSSSPAKKQPKAFLPTKQLRDVGVAVSDQLSAAGLFPVAVS